jgi:hypothetical protein
LGPQERRDETSSIAKAEPDVPACMTCPNERPAETHGINPIELLTGEITRRTEVGSSIPSRAERMGRPAQLPHMTLEAIRQVSDIIPAGTPNMDI